MKIIKDLIFIRIRQILCQIRRICKRGMALQAAVGFLPYVELAENG